MRSTGLVSKARALISFDNYIVLAAMNGWSYTILKPELSHQHPGFNGEIVNERFDLLSSENHRLYITEFDSKHYNISERALDVEDFLRMAYSHPHIDQIITWYFMETEASSQFMDDQKRIHKL